MGVIPNQFMTTPEFDMTFPEMKCGHVVKKNDYKRVISQVNEITRQNWCSHLCIMCLLTFLLVGIPIGMFAIGMVTVYQRDAQSYSDLTLFGAIASICCILTLFMMCCLSKRSNYYGVKQVQEYLDSYVNNARFIFTLRNQTGFFGQQYLELDYVERNSHKRAKQEIFERYFTLIFPTI